MSIDVETLGIIQNCLGDAKLNLSDPSIFERSIGSEQRTVLQKTAVWVQEFFNESDKKGVTRGGHGFDHCRRNVGYAAFVAASEGYDTFIPTLTALLIDVGRAVDDIRATDWRHGELSAEDIAEKVIGKI